MTRAATARYDQEFCDLIRSKTGIRLQPDRRQMIEVRLRGRIKALGAADLDGYLGQLFGHGKLAEELPQVIDLLTTNKTDFFREPSHFDILTRQILPEAIRRGAKGSTPLVKVWSAASSDGAEAYTVAMVLAEAMRATAGFGYAVLGTDISLRMIERADRAIFSVQQLEAVPQILRDRYTLRSGCAATANFARMVPELRGRVRFEHLNLMDKSYPVDRNVDVIFLRNVLIYFGPEDQAAVIARLVGHLASGGYLIVGHSESMTVSHPLLHQQSPAVFRKK